MLLLFLKDLRATLIIGVSIPISIVATFFLMYQTGTSLNIMSLGGLALGVGMLVDNAIVVLEAIVKRREAGDDAFTAAHAGASEVGRAVIASTLTTVAVFLPVVFLEGIAAQLFRDQALTVSFSLLASLAVSLTLIPMLIAVIGGRTQRSRRPRQPPTGRIRRTGGWFWSRSRPLCCGPCAGWPAASAGCLAVPARPLAALFDRAFGAVAAAYPPLLGCGPAATGSPCSRSRCCPRRGGRPRPHAWGSI